jgi:hypothetical protein
MRADKMRNAPADAAAAPAPSNAAQFNTIIIQ